MSGSAARAGCLPCVVRCYSVGKIDLESTEKQGFGRGPVCTVECKGGFDDFGGFGSFGERGPGIAEKYSVYFPNPLPHPDPLPTRRGKREAAGDRPADKSHLSGSGWQGRGVAENVGAMVQEGCGCGCHDTGSHDIGKGPHGHHEEGS